MMYEGHIIYDVSGEEKKNLHVSDLLAKFQIASGGEFAERPHDLVLNILHLTKELHPANGCGSFLARK